MEKKLQRDEHRKVIAGVCAGLAEYLAVDVTLVRLVFVAAAILLKGSGILVYIILWIVLPRKNYAFFNPTVDYTVPPVGPPPMTDPFIYTPPLAPPAPPRRSGGTLIGGLVLITIGTLFLLDQFNIIPNWDFENLWPVILIVVGLGIMFTGNNSGQWKNVDTRNWNSKTETTPTDNPPMQQL
jgi:phage shock protein PspC (stress-responsive transcriptional regulator)